MRIATVVAAMLAACALGESTNNVTLSESLSYSKSGTQVLLPAETFQCAVGGNGLVQNVQDIPATGSVALAMGGIGTQGLFRIKNISASNYVDVGAVSGSDFVPFVRLFPGRTARMWLSTNAPRALANGSTVKVFYMATDN